MYATDRTDLARVLVEDRLREARARHLADELSRHQQSPLAPEPQQPPRRSGLLRLVHVRVHLHRAYS